MTTTALDRLSPYARGALSHVLEGADNPNNITAAIVVDTLAEKVALLQQFDPLATWGVTVLPDLGHAWVARWDRLALFIPDAGDLRLPRCVVTQRAIARKRLRLDVVNTVDALGLRNRRTFLKPAIDAPPAQPSPPWDLNSGTARAFAKGRHA